MRKSILKFALGSLLVVGSLSTILAQDKVKIEKDTVNADKVAKPVFYDAAAEEGKTCSNPCTLPLIIGGVVVVAGVAFFLLKKKKK